MAKNKQNTQIEIARIESTGATIRSLIKWGFLFGIACCATVSIYFLAGKYTLADIKIDAKGEAKVTTDTESNRTKKGDNNQKSTNETLYGTSDCKPSVVGDLLLPTSLLCFIVGIGGIVYGRSQSKALETHIRAHAAQYQALEKKIDPKRSSSNLGENGQTRPEDDL